ncbi:TIGR04149 family rSAM-modified RiPP [Sphingobacterium lumbrici]|uniref:TIGR04149 family rSAM-modified RiPP n=1 Tax=Sphingobacterium lumbrici TaxID=2559600 RepID=UPI001127437E
MKKISLKSLNLSEVEQLSRSQLKDVLGGFMSTSDSITIPGCTVRCENIGHNCTTSDCKVGSCGYIDGYLQCSIS